MLLKDDTLIIAGKAFDSLEDRQVALFVKMDTLGNILDYRFHLDPEGDHYAFNNKYAIIPTMDGGYAMNCFRFTARSNILMKLDVNGDVEFLKEFVDSSVLTTFQLGIIELTDGYLISGTKQQLNGHNDVYVMKVDKEGSEIWTKLYGEYAISENLGKCVQVDDNTFVIGAHKGIGTPSPYDSTTTWCRAWLFAIDSLGNTKWEFQAEKYEDCAVWELVQTADGGWIYPTSRAEIIPEYFNNVFGSTCKVIRRDANFNEVWSKEVSPTSWEVNYLPNIAATPDGGWVASGRWVLPTTPTAIDTDYRWIAGCIYKLSADGDSIWSRCDTVAMPYETFEHYYNGMVVLPSGSLVVVGSFLGDGKSHGWVVKVDKDGCLEELCKVSGVEDLEQGRGQAVLVYPNPATTSVTFELAQPVDDGVITVTDFMGRAVWSNHVPLHSTKIGWATEGLPNGIYYFRLEKGKKIGSSWFCMGKHLSYCNPSFQRGEHEFPLAHLSSFLNINIKHLTKDSKC